MSSGPQPSTPKAMTLRLHADQAEALEWVAAIEAKPVTEVIRTAIAQHLESLRTDQTFQEGLSTRLRHAQQLLGSNTPRAS